MVQTSLTNQATGFYNARLHTELSVGDWEGLHKSASEWLQAEPDQPVATFVQNMACLFANPPSMIRNKRYLETVGNKDWKAVLTWYGAFQSEVDRHNAYFQALDFILQPPTKKKSYIERALQEHPDNPELLFLQAISFRDRAASIAKLKQAVASKPEFPAALYLLGIFSLELGQVQTAEDHLKRAATLAPDFLEAHYQLGSLYSLYVPDAKERAAQHFQKVIELDPEGGAGKDAKKVLEQGTPPQYGQRISAESRGRRGGGSILVILGISMLTAVLFSGPIAAWLKITTPLIGIVAGLFVFIGLYSAWNRGK